jgi:hypothetical protein
MSNDKKMNDAVAKGVSEVYDKFQSDMILWDRGKGMGDAYGRKYGTYIVLTFLGFIFLIIASGLSMFTGIEVTHMFWYCVFAVIIYLFTIQPFVTAASYRREARSRLDAKARAYKASHAGRDVAAAEARYKSDLQSIDIN